MCIFCEILQNDKNNQIIYRGKNITAIRKNYRSETVNFLLISNKHIEKFSDLDMTIPEDLVIWTEIMTTAKNLMNDKDFGIKISNGEKAGQTIFHAHVHIFSFENST